MNTPNPLIPKGSLLEQTAKGKPHLRVACIIVAIHMVFLGGLLIQGCKKEDLNAKANPLTNDSALPPLDQSNLYPTNAPQPTNLLPQDLTQTGAPPAANPTPQNLPLMPPPVESAAPAATREYVVVKHDSFSTIGKKFGVSWNAIAKANPGVDSTRLKVGQKLVVPAPASATIAAAAAGNSSENSYVVKTGDTLHKIARANGTSVNEIKALNGLKTDRIKVGDKLKLPASKPAPVTATPGGPGNL
ncbi:MAG: hypothetical protein DME24_25045 [Verrucomicrobia bacterium]|nr:MAG: hypothetical protein DME24_25045 [Verrucomicrobiota bacterium]